MLKLTHKKYEVFNLVFGLVAWLRLTIYLKKLAFPKTLFLKATFAVQYEMNLNEFHIIMDVSRPMGSCFFLGGGSSFG